MDKPPHDVHLVADWMVMALPIGNKGNDHAEFTRSKRVDIVDAEGEVIAQVRPDHADTIAYMLNWAEQHMPRSPWPVEDAFDHESEQARFAIDRELGARAINLVNELLDQGTRPMPQHMQAAKIDVSASELRIIIKAVEKFRATKK